MSSSKNIQLVLLAVLALAVCGLLLPDPISSGGALTWISVPFPLFVAVVMVYYAQQASLRNESRSAEDILKIAAIAIGSMGVIAN